MPREALRGESRPIRPARLEKCCERLGWIFRSPDAERSRPADVAHAMII